MKLHIWTIRATIVLCIFSGLTSAALFEETLAVRVPRAVYGPRGMMGDLITLKDGTLIEGLVMATATNPSVRRIPATGDLLFVWGSEASTDKTLGTPRRCALTTAISQDEGNTFIHQRNIARDPEDDYGYQCIEFMGKDLAVLGYHCRDGLRVARIGIDWFYER